MFGWSFRCSSSDGKEKKNPERFCLFAEEEQAARSSENAEVLRERRRKDERRLQETREYLGGGGKRDDPWYATARERPQTVEAEADASRDQGKQQRRSRRDDHRKKVEDPLPSKSPESAPSTPARKHHSTPPTRNPLKMSMMEKLRTERLVREQKERDRIKTLVDQNKPNGSRSFSPAIVQDDRRREYHEGFTVYSGGKRRSDHHRFSPQRSNYRPFSPRHSGETRRGKTSQRDREHYGKARRLEQDDR